MVMKNQTVYTCTLIIFVLLLLKFEIISGGRYLCKEPGCKPLKSISGLSFLRPRHYEINDDTIDYDDKHLHFKRTRFSKKNRHLLLPRIFPRTIYTDFLSKKDRDLREQKEHANGHIKDYKCFKCDKFGSEPQCGTNWKDYENSCYRECDGFPVVDGVSLGTFFPDLPGYDSPGLVSMGKCPKCNCEQIWEANFNQAGSVDKICTSLCNADEKHHHIDCTGNKKINGPCICPQNSRKVDLIEWDQQCGSDGKIYEDACRRECAGVAEISHEICKACKCTLVWQRLKCGGNLEEKFSTKCIEKCKKELAEIEKTSYVGCEISTNFICKCPIYTEIYPVCGDDHVLYPNLCQLQCAGRKLLSANKCPDCKCLESVWSKECGATNFLPIRPGCEQECLRQKKLLSNTNQKIVCNTKTSKKACLCPSQVGMFTQCGADGEYYETGCERKCNDVSSVAYWGPCVAKQCNCREVWRIKECNLPGNPDPYCVSQCEKPKSVTWVGCYHRNKTLCACNKRSGKPHCSRDGVLYPNKCPLDCLGLIGFKDFHKYSSEDCKPKYGR